jgi:hypothetical protein
MNKILLQNKPTTFEEGKTLLVKIIQGMGTHLKEYQDKYVGNSDIKNLVDRTEYLYPYAEKYLQDYIGTRQFYILLIALAQLCLKPFMENIETCLTAANRFFGSLELTAEIEDTFKEEE